VARFQPTLRRLLDHRVRLLAVDGQLDTRQLRLCGLTEQDVRAELRQHGVFDLEQVCYLLYEVKGGLTVVPAEASTGDLITNALESTGHRHHRCRR
jgi:uncharacterized membrane protein YcaP (DUF421 family)